MGGLGYTFLIFCIKLNNSQAYLSSQCSKTFWSFWHFSARKSFFFVEGSQDGGEGLLGLETVGQVEKVWLPRGHQGDRVTQANSKHTGDFGGSVGQGKSTIAFLLLVSKQSLCHAV